MHVNPADGRATGQAFVEFATTGDAETAKDQRNRQMMGNRYIEIFPSDREEASRATGLDLS